MRKEVFVLLVALLLVLAGCGPKTPTGGGGTTPFLGGSEGLRVSFVDNAPPTEVLDNPNAADRSQAMRFDVALRLDNVGETDIATSNVKASVGGFYPPDFDKTSADLQNVLLSTKITTGSQKIDGARKDPDGAKLPGGTEEIVFKDLGYLKTLQGNNPYPIQADFCYRYETKAVGNFCMRQDLTKTSGGVCAVKGTKTVYSSGSPVHVTSLDESVGGKTKVILKFGITSVGTGSFFRPDASGPPSCSKGDFRNENFVRVTVNTGVNGLTCSGFSGGGPSSSQVVGDVRLSNGAATVTCYQDGVTVDAVQNVNVQVDYNHLISASTSLLVKHLPSDSGTGLVGGSVPTTGSGSTGNPAGGTACTSGNGNSCTTSQGCPGSQICSGQVLGPCTDIYPNDGCPASSTCSNPIGGPTYATSCQLCTGSDSGGTWNGPAATQPCSCPNGKTFDIPSAKCTAACSSGQVIGCTVTSTGCPGTQSCSASGTFGACTDTFSNDNCPASSSSTCTNVQPRDCNNNNFCVGTQACSGTAWATTPSTYAAGATCVDTNDNCPSKYANGGSANEGYMSSCSGKGGTWFVNDIGSVCQCPSGKTWDIIQAKCV